MKQRGRPLKGGERRQRTSLTLEPSCIEWLQEQAEASDSSVSDLLNRLVAECAKGKRSIAKELPSEVANRMLHSVVDERLQKLCRKHKVRRLSVFGSILGKSFDESSDIDLLVDFDASASPTLFSLSKLSDELSSIFGGREVDLRTSEELSSLFRESVLAEAKLLYG